MTTPDSTPDTGTGTGTVQVYRMYIRATAERIWAAITDPDWNQRYGYGAPGFFDLQPGGRYYSTASDDMRAASEKRGWPVPDVIVDGEVVESDPPRRLVHTWRMLTDPETAAEPFTRLTYEIYQGDNGVCRLTLTHELTGAPQTAEMVAGATRNQRWQRRRRVVVGAQRPEDAAGDRERVPGRGGAGSLAGPACRRPTRRRTAGQARRFRHRRRSGPAA